MAIPKATALQLDAAVRLVCPAIDGVSVGDVNDKTTWRIQFQEAATADQIAAADAALQSFTPS